MSQDRPAAIRRSGSRTGRIIRAWGSLTTERRLAATAAVGLFLTLFLPWYQQTVIAKGTSALQSTSVALSGWGAFSFAEALLLLTAAAVLVLLFERADGRRFRVPGGDGAAIIAAGSWASLLILWRIFDKQGTDGHGLYATASGVEWGIFVALAVSVLLAYSGSRVRAANEPEPDFPEDDGIPFWGPPSPAPASPAEGAPAPETPAARATRVSERAAPPPTRASERPSAEAPPTRISEPEPAEGPPTRVSRRDRTSPFGPPVVPEDPPAMRLGKSGPRADVPPDEQMTMPLDSDNDA